MCEVFISLQTSFPRKGRVRKRQGLVPDFMLEMEKDGNRRLTTMAVDRSVGALTKEYRAEAVGVDRAFGGVADEITGIVLRKLKGFVEVRGLVFGAFGESCERVHLLGC